MSPSPCRGVNDPEKQSHRRSGRGRIQLPALFMPESIPLAVIRMLAFAASFVQVAHCPLLIAFGTQGVSYMASVFVELVTCFIIAADIWITSRAAYHDKEGYLITDSHQIRRRTWIKYAPWAILGAFPITTLLQPFAPETALMFLQMHSLFHLHRWWRLAKDKGEELLVSHQLTLAFYFVAVLQLIHWYSCGWWMLEKHIDHRQNEPTWASKYAYVNLYSSHFEQNPMDRYIYVFLWVLTVVVVPGQGNEKSANTAETILSNVYSWTGALLLAIYIATFFSHLTNTLSEKSRVEHEIRSMCRYLHKRGIDESAQKRVAAYYTQIWNVHQGRLRFVQLFDGLPSGTRAELLLKVYGDSLRKVPLFSPCSPPVIKCLACLTREVFFAQGEVIVNKNDIGIEMYMIKSGHAQVISDDHTRVWADLRPGSFMGELSLFNQVLRTATIIAATACDVYVLGREELDFVLSVYPEEALGIFARAEQRLKDVSTKNTSLRDNPELAKELQFDATSLVNINQPLPQPRSLLSLRSSAQLPSQSTMSMVTPSRAMMQAKIFVPRASARHGSRRSIANSPSMRSRSSSNMPGSPVGSTSTSILGTASHESSAPKITAVAPTLASRARILSGSTSNASAASSASFRRRSSILRGAAALPIAAGRRMSIRPGPKVPQEEPGTSAPGPGKRRMSIAERLMPAFSARTESKTVSPAQGRGDQAAPTSSSSTAIVAGGRRTSVIPLRRMSVFPARKPSHDFSPRPSDVAYLTSETYNPFGAPQEPILEAEPPATTSVPTSDATALIVSTALVPIASDSGSGSTSVTTTLPPIAPATRCPPLLSLAANHSRSFSTRSSRSDSSTRGPAKLLVHESSAAPLDARPLFKRKKAMSVNVLDYYRRKPLNRPGPQSFRSLQAIPRYKKPIHLVPLP